MARKKKELPLLENILITDVAAEGKAIAKVDNLVIFVPYVVPGDIVDLQIKRKKHSYAEAEAVKFHKLSDQRVGARQTWLTHFSHSAGLHAESRKLLPENVAFAYDNLDIFIP